MRNDTEDDVGVVYDPKEEPPGLVHPALPDVAGFIDLFCTDGRVSQIGGQQPGLLVKGFLHS